MQQYLAGIIDLGITKEVWGSGRVPQPGWVGGPGVWDPWVGGWVRFVGSPFAAISFVLDMLQPPQAPILQFAPNVVTLNSCLFSCLWQRSS